MGTWGSDCPQNLSFWAEGAKCIQHVWLDTPILTPASRGGQQSLRPDGSFGREDTANKMPSAEQRVQNAQYGAAEAPDERVTEPLERTCGGLGSDGGGHRAARSHEKQTFPPGLPPVTLLYVPRRPPFPPPQRAQRSARWARVKQRQPKKGDTESTKKKAN